MTSLPESVDVGSGRSLAELALMVSFLEKFGAELAKLSAAACFASSVDDALAGLGSSDAIEVELLEVLELSIIGGFSRLRRQPRLAKRSNPCVRCADWRWVALSARFLGKSSFGVPDDSLRLGLEASEVCFESSPG